MKQLTTERWYGDCPLDQNAVNDNSIQNLRIKGSQLATGREWSGMLASISQRRMDTKTLWSVRPTVEQTMVNATVCTKSHLWCRQIGPLGWGWGHKFGIRVRGVLAWLSLGTSVHKLQEDFLCDGVLDAVAYSCRTVPDTHNRKWKHSRWLTLPTALPLLPWKHGLCFS